MWLTLREGFFSVVKKPGDDSLTVRARVRGDLDRLRQRCPGLGPTRATPEADYSYRSSVRAEDLAATLADLVLALDYSNFKDEVAKLDGPRRAHLYGDVWSVLYGAEGKVGRSRRPTPRQ